MRRIESTWYIKCEAIEGRLDHKTGEHLQLSDNIANRLQSLSILSNNAALPSLIFWRYLAANMAANLLVTCLMDAIYSLDANAKIKSCFARRMRYVSGQ